MRPEFTPEVLAQKSRDVVSQLGFSQRNRDESFGFGWNSDLIKFIQDNDKPSPRWPDVLAQAPSPLHFWYRQSGDTLTAMSFHTDLLTPGIVDLEDPPPIMSGMSRVELDHRGRLTLFETIPPQRDEAPTPTRHQSIGIRSSGWQAWIPQS